jgi:MFS family permease
MMFDIVFALLNGINLSIIIMNIPPVLSELMDLYGVSYTQISVLMSALLWMHAAMQLPAGMIVDRLVPEPRLSGRRKRHTGHPP